jgi:hypothetical protein
MQPDFDKLREPFPSDWIEWRVGSTNRDKTKGMALAYIDARSVMDRLDDVCGPDGWQCKYSHANGKTVCDIGILCSEQWVWKADGAGDTDFEAEKGALSDAFKRAAVRWGIGRYLYDLKAPWVAIEAFGKSYKIADHELPKLRALLSRPVGSNGNGATVAPAKAKTSRDLDWRGPMTKTALSNELRAFAAALGKPMHIPEELDNLLDEYDPVIGQCKVDMPGWWNGDGMPQDFVPLEKRVEAKRRQIAGLAQPNTILGAA